MSLYFATILIARVVVQSASRTCAQWPWTRFYGYDIHSLTPCRPHGSLFYFYGPEHNLGIRTPDQPYRYKTHTHHMSIIRVSPITSSLFPIPPQS
ncbi:hypothetical protein F4859DRAFT_493771 [Xylaria cf. heliscus]|nr:hypothetical protein F4859DRAFT_493771 [Xylaria cf. heliscus]